ncbi:MAG TPA: response regulator [Vicinamibacterales bacterium]|jgi:two-component system chemotaxis response regulator CheY|nr:response regulator [Vicinamibacterales bacterium]
MRILIVDDSSMMRALIKRVITLTELPDAEVLEASNGAEALRILEAQTVNLLLTDVNMPGMSGVELLREIARQDRWPKLVRVIISTDGSPSRRGEAADLDVRCYLEKPFSPEVLRHVLSEAAESVHS